MLFPFQGVIYTYVLVPRALPWADSLMAFDFPFGRRPLVLRLKPQAQAEQADFTGQQ